MVSRDYRMKLTLRAVNILDKSSRRFVEEILKDPNTILIVSSDHGKGSGHRLPLFSMVLPVSYMLQGGPGDSFDLEQNLFRNQQELISWFDVYRTLKHLISLCHLYSRG